MVLRSATEHRRSSYVNLLNRLLEGNPGAGNGFLEGIKIHHDQIDHFDAMFGSGFQMLLISPQT